MAELRTFKTGGITVASARFNRAEVASAISHRQAAALSRKETFAEELFS